MQVGTGAAADMDTRFRFVLVTDESVSHGCFRPLEAIGQNRATPRLRRPGR
jgi:hypothetical protein